MSDVDLAPYRRQIVRITEERNQARAERDHAQDKADREIRILRAQLSEAVSPRVAALNHELKRNRSDLMRGKEAIQAANRRAREAEAAAAKVRADCERARDEAQRELAEAKQQLTHLTANINSEASRLASKEAERLMALEKEQRSKRGLSDVAIIWQMEEKDLFIRNCCKYLSMTDAKLPPDALEQVLCWATDNSFEWRGSVEATCDRLGVSRTGWVAWILAKDVKWIKAARARAAGRRETYQALDKAEETGNTKIHPDYKPAWYEGSPPGTGPRADRLDKFGPSKVHAR